MGWQLVNTALPGGRVEHTLLLGGTGSALRLARGLIAQGHQLTYSIAGLVRQPDLSCTVISGGFTQFGGMASYIHTHNISLIIDATHPYAAQISQHAVAAAATCEIPCWRLQRPSWQATDGDSWLEFADWDALLPALQDYQRIFLSQGRLSASQLKQLADYRRPEQQFFLRTAVTSPLDLPRWISPIQAIGPFNDDDELALFRQLQIDALVSKNSGGKMTEAKLKAARGLAISVLMLRRPELPEVDREFFEVGALLQYLPYP